MMDSSTKLHGQKEFFTSSEIQYFKKWAHEIYDSSRPEHQEVKEHLMSTVWQKTGEWANRIEEVLPRYETRLKKIWSERGWLLRGGKKTLVSKFKHYTWAKIFLSGHEDKGVFFTVGLSSIEEKFEIALDFKREGTTLNVLQKEVCRSFLDDERLKPSCIPFDDILAWTDLVRAGEQYIVEKEMHYLQLIDLVWKTDVHVQFSDRRLVNYELPKSYKKLIGEIGEEIVLKLELERLTNTGSRNLVNVKQVKDSYGFDIISYDEWENEIYIEVKSTTKSLNDPFYMSRNQKVVCEANPDKYLIYRIYDLDFTQVPPIYGLLIISPSDKNIAYEPIEYKVIIS
jgi:hypothetical protein